MELLNLIILYWKNNSKRIIRLSEVLKKRITSIQENVNASIQNNFNYYNKYKNNKKDILNDIYSVDEEGNEYCHGIKIESEKMTDKEVKELENILKNFK